MVFSSLPKVCPCPSPIQAELDSLRYGPKGGGGGAGREVELLAQEVKRNFTTSACPAGCTHGKEEE